MRPKVPCYLLTFDATADAIRFESWCGTHNIPGRLIPLPGEISAGCGMAWKTVRSDAEEHFREHCEASGIPVAQFFEIIL